MSLSSVDFDFLSFLEVLLIVLSGFLGVGRACLEAGLYSCGLKYDRFVGLLWFSDTTGNRLSEKPSCGALHCAALSLPEAT